MADLNRAAVRSSPPVQPFPSRDHCASFGGGRIGAGRMIIAQTHLTLTPVCRTIRPDMAARP